MGLPKGPTEGGSGGQRGHSGMEHWGFADEVKEAAKKRRRLDDKDDVKPDPDLAVTRQPTQSKDTTV